MNVSQVVRTKCRARGKLKLYLHEGAGIPQCLDASPEAIDP
jgi:hypothetical protein